MLFLLIGFFILSLILGKIGESYWIIRTFPLCILVLILGMINFYMNYKNKTVATYFYVFIPLSLLIINLIFIKIL